MKKPRKKRIKKREETVTYWKKLLDKEMSRLICSTGFCSRCRSTITLQNAHVVPRTNLALRWNPMNLLCLCLNCHIMWAHKDPLAFTAWFKEKYPARYDYVTLKRNEIKKRGIPELQELLNAAQMRDIKFLIDN